MHEAGTTQLSTKFFEKASSAGIDTDPRVVGAVAFAGLVHEKQKYRERPIIQHLLRVAIRVVDQLEVHDPDIVASTILKNSLNDRAFKIGRLNDKEKVFINQSEARGVASRELEQMFGKEVAEIVGTLTKPVVPKDQFQARKRIYNDHIDFVVRNHPGARIIALADFMDYFAAEDRSVRKFHRVKRDRECFDRFRIHQDGLFLADSLIPEPLRTKVLRRLQKDEADARRRLGIE